MKASLGRWYSAAGRRETTVVPSGEETTVLLAGGRRGEMKTVGAGEMMVGGVWGCRGGVNTVDAGGEMTVLLPAVKGDETTVLPLRGVRGV